MRLQPLSFAHSPESALIVSLAVLSLLGGASTALAAEERVCGTAEPSAVEAQAIQAELESKLAAPSRQTAVGGIVRVAFHVIHNGVEGNVTDAQIQAQIAELNLDFSGAAGGYDTGYRFVLASIDRTLNTDWFNMVMGSGAEKRCKEALAVDPTHHINVYTADISSLGWSTFPWGVDEDDIYQGIFVDYGSLPGGHITNFNMGRTVTHEIGHYLGLFHTFFSGCSEPNDYVTDTPAQAAQTTGCPDETTDTCPLPGLDPIHNFLDYSYDACYAEFTPGQDARMDGIVSTCKPNLISAPLAVADQPREAIAMLRPVVPNPSGRRVKLSFSLRREGPVTLRVHDLAGRVVARLVEGVLPAGDHARIFEAGPEASGVYFAELAAGGQRTSRRVIVTR